jgi:uncharacterized protein YqjF (DUF2071 family)
MGTLDSVLPASYPVAAPPLRRPVISDQQWRSLTFLHWPVDPMAVAPLFPPGARPDVLGGVSYVGLVPFHMHAAGPRPWLRIPYFGDFLETNVRLYSVDAAGRHGVVFRSLETQRLAVALLARAVHGVPYAWARMRHTTDGPVVHYESRRRWPGRGLRTNITIRVGDPVTPTALEVWLTARWGVHAQLAGRTVWIPNRHPTWPLYQAQLLHLDDELVAAAGITPTGAALRPLWSPGVRACFGRPSAVLGRRPRAVPIGQLTPT